MTVLFVALSLMGVSCTKYDEASLTLETDVVSRKAGFQRIRVDVTGDWTLTLTYLGDQKDWATLDRTSGDVDQTSIRLNYEENKEEEDRELRLTVQCGKVSQSYTLVQRGQGVARTANDWMELPQIFADADESKFRFFTHTMTVSSVKTRNYSFYWSYADRVSLWVAYPLNDWNRGSYYGRSDAWALDPLLPSSDQSDVTRTYSQGTDKNWYNRGHQIPSADRQGSYANNAATYYGTNMTPQNGEFNSGLWASLEGCVRNWASKSDTLYVLTGCVVDGAKHYVKDAADSRVTIPVGYFKALLRYKTSSTIGYSDFVGCAFYFDHAKYSIESNANQAVSSTMSMSIAELEDILGYSLFVNLDDKVGEDTAEKIKSQDPQSVSWWWQNK